MLCKVKKHLICLFRSTTNPFGASASNSITYKVIEQLPRSLLVKINEMVGFRLLTKAGEKGIINLTQIVPVVGGVIGGGVDAITCRIVGKAAKRAFQ